ncbi:MAG TPA: hypothetical protein VLD36_18000 [Burkholderiales bacterium]|nr:hypothetical protein [Burkholderiales bacterium]
MPVAFHRRIQLDLTRELVPQLQEMLADPDPEISSWAEENLRFELERAKFAVWLERRGIAGERLLLEEPGLLDQFRAERRPKLAVVRSR